ncbi:MAG: hypothetical protein J6Y79_03800 [Paludibacteraceae bacterium]|nr:hypothetical protein [Paludibacteraceae bacterium]
MSNSKIIKLFFAIFLVFLLRGVKGDAVRARFAGGAYSCALESSLSLDLTQTAKRESRAEKKKGRMKRLMPHSPVVRAELFPCDLSRFYGCFVHGRSRAHRKR